MIDAKKRVISIAIAVLAVLTLSLAGCSGGGEDLSLDASAISNTFEAVKADISELKAANEVIHSETRAILKGSEPLAGDVAAMVKTPHMSSHAVLIIMPYLEATITEIEAYIANPEANRGKILVSLGEIEAYGKLVEATVGGTDWASLMNWPITETTSHDLVHAFGDDPAIQAIPAYQEAAEKVHTAMHGIEDSLSSLELDLELLRDMIKTAGKVD